MTLNHSVLTVLRPGMKRDNPEWDLDDFDFGDPRATLSGGGDGLVGRGPGVEFFLLGSFFTPH